jgi:hypothetical protein
MTLFWLLALAGKCQAVIQTYLQSKIFILQSEINAVDLLPFDFAPFGRLPSAGSLRQAQGIAGHRRVKFVDLLRI